MTTFTRGENPLRADKLNTAFSERVNRVGDTMQGRLNLIGDPVAPLEAATKQYVDRFTSMGVPTGAYIGAAPPGNVLGPLWWDTNSGQLFIQYNDGSSTQWVSASSIDASQLAGSFLPLSGGHVTGKLQIGATDWLEAIIPSTEQFSDFVSLSKVAGSGGIFGTRTSDGGATGGMGAWSVGAFAINNNTTAVQNAYGHYVEVRRYPNAGVTEGMEIGVINEGDLKQCQPYYMAQPGSTIGLFLGSGRDDVTPNNDNSMALGITGGNALWDRGILFNWNSVRQTPGIGSVALGMPPQFALVWYLNDGGASLGAGVPAALIRSDATSVSGLAHPPSLLFGNGSLAFDPGNNVDAAIFRVGENVLQSTQINTPAGTPYLSLNGLAGAAKSLFWQNSGTNRWAMQTDGSDNLALYAYNSGGTFAGTPMIFNPAVQTAGFGWRVQSTTSIAAATNDICGASFDASNTGSNVAQGHRFTYRSSAANNGFDVGATVLGLFDPTFIAGQVPAYFGMWIVGQSPNDTTHPWQTCAAEIDVVNRGADMGWLRDRSTTTSTGGLLVVPEITVFGGGAGEGKNATYGYTASKAGGNNSTGFPAKFYNCFLAEPNSAVGLTGRAIYVTGDITGTASQYPYGPLQTDGTWLHGIDHTKAVYTDSHAEVMAVGQATAWITGTTVSPTGTATLAASGSGANISLTLTPAGTGTVTVAGPANVEGNVTVGTVTSSGAHINVVSTATTQPGVAFYSVVTGAASQRWQVGTDQYPESGGDAGDNFAIYSYHDNGTFNGQALLISRVAPFQAQFFGPVLHSGGFGAFDAAATTTKPTVSGSRAGNAALASLLTTLATYGLIVNSSTA